eukprot:TRINITY_DN14256_c0_g1_i1.p1 TRINITY_DN14256_c0_g1~~TRINITY_DN14256_c0_g1_i1.p1  ORF type:complete len:999 (+),score=162.83 TRINITY_DN14256_c0_g1_i1:35-3031(+)
MAESNASSNSSSSGDVESADDDHMSKFALSSLVSQASQLTQTIRAAQWPEDIDRSSPLYNDIVEDNIRVCALVSFLDKLMWCATRPLDLIDSKVTVIYSLRWTEFGGYMIIYMSIFAVVDVLTMLMPARLYPWFLIAVAVDICVYCINPELVRFSGREAKWNARSLTCWSMTFATLVPLVIPNFKLVIAYTLAFCCIYFVVHVTALLCLQTPQPWSGFLDLCCSTGVILAVAIASIRSKDQLERVEWKASIADCEAEQTAERFVLHLQDLLPSFIVPRVLQPDGAVSDKIQCASIMFILIDDFDRMTHSMAPESLLAFLNNVFLRFDKICAGNDVTKIETIGEEYVCAVGVSPRDVRHTEKYGHEFVLQKLLRVSSAVSTETNVVTKMGIHTGPVVAGVLGHKLPRFRLFGNTVNTAARMMQNALPGTLQFGEQTREHVPGWVRYVPRGKIEMKGKGMVMTYTIQFPLASPTATSSESGSDFSDSSEESFLVNESSKGPSRMTTTNFARHHAREKRRRTAQQTVSQMTKSEAQRSRIRKRELLKQILCSGHAEFREWLSNRFSLSDFRKHARTQSFSLLALTAVELAYMLGFQLRHLVAKTMLVRTFCGYSLCRFACLLNLWTWVLAARSCRFSNTWLLLGEQIISMNLLLLSYFFLLGSFIDDVEGVSTFTLSGTSDELLTLTCFGAYLQTVMSRKFPFKETCVFLALHATPAILVEELLLRAPVDFKLVWFEVIVCVVLLILCRSIAIEWSLLRQWHAQITTARVSKSIKDIVDSLLPPLVVQSMSREHASHRYKEAIVAQSDLCGFTKLASQLPPETVMAMIGEIFLEFDNLADEFGMYKVETVGDAYIAAQAEHPLTAQKSTLGAVRFGLGMLSAIETWAEKRRQQVKCRVGIHYGQCIGGVVGSSMKRYHLFGRMMTIVEVLESTAPEGGLQVSNACRSALGSELGEQTLRNLLTLSQRTEPVLTTSKGVVHSYDEVSGPTFLVTGINALWKE